MSPQMDVLYLNNLGHVLAIFTRTAEPDQLETAADPFVGNALHLRGLGDPKVYSSISDFNDQDFVIPSAQVKVFRTDLNPSQLLTPRDLYATNLDSTPTVQAFPGTSLALPATPPATSLPLTITLPSPPASPTDILVLVEGQALGSPVQKPVRIPAGQPPPQATVSVPGLPSGNYYAIIFVPAFPIAVVPFKV